MGESFEAPRSVHLAHLHGRQSGRDARKDLGRGTRGFPYEDCLSARLLARPKRQRRVGTDPGRPSPRRKGMVSALQRRRTGLRRDVKMAVTEWNCAADGMLQHHPRHHPFGPAYALRDALAAGVFLNVRQRNCQLVTWANVAQTLKVAGLIMVTADGV